MSDKKLTVADVERAVKKIGAVARDPEDAHSQEDALHCLVLSAIAAGDVADEDVRAVAAAAIKTKDIDFPRWCA